MGLFDMRTCRMPSAILAQRVLEQFTVAGTVYVDPHTYKCMDGELIEKGIIMPYKKCEIEPQGLFTFDIDTVQRMLSERGYDINYYTTEEISGIFSDWQKKFKEYVELEREYGLDYFTISISRTVGIDPKRGYSGIDIDRFLELGDYIHSHNPVIDVLLEYRKLFDIAYHNNLLSPVINATNRDKNSSSNAGKTIPVMEGDKAIKILRFTSEKLDRIYTAATLRDNTKLVQTDEAKAYRSKVDEWIGAFSEQNFDNMQMLEDDIVKAQKAMKNSKLIVNTGIICATVGVVSTVLSKNPEYSKPGALIAEIATYCGAPMAFLNPTKRYLWASFGMYQK